MLFVHSLLRYVVLLLVLAAFLAHLRDWILRRPIIVWERTAAILALVACHVQLVVGIALYGMNATVIHSQNPGAWWRFILHVHAASMLAAIVLVTAGRMLSKRAKDERMKQLWVVVGYGLGLALMAYATPWPFTEIGRTFGKGWL
ncbi:MAG: hypothetical protein ACK4L7_00730 [Flavobacteriales bacterium]